MRKIIISLFILGIIAPLLSLGLAAEKAPRYISLAPSTTEILFALGLENEIVGVSSYCNYPAEAENKEKIGDFSNPNIEKILSLKPDYIFCTGLEQAPVIAALRKLELNVYVADPVDMDGLLTTIGQIGRITAREKEAEALIEEMRRKAKIVFAQVEKVPPEKRPKVFIEIWSSPLTTAGKGTFVDELITLAGGINIAADTKRPYSIFSEEEVIRRNPDYIIFTYMEKEKPKKLIERRVGWEKINAFVNNRMYNDINPDIILRPGPRIVEGLQEVHRKLYPENE